MELKNIFGYKLSCIDKLVFLCIYLFESDKLYTGVDIYDKSLINAPEARAAIKRLIDCGLVFRANDGRLCVNKTEHIAVLFAGKVNTARYDMRCSFRGWHRIFSNVHEKLIFLYLREYGAAKLEDIVSVCYKKPNNRSFTYIKNILDKSDKIELDGVFYRIKG